jgi:uncharacterized protein YcbX
MINVAALWRHPIKSHGRESLEQVVLTPGHTMPFDRAWAVTHDRSKFDAEAPDWVSCRNFMIGASTPNLAGIWARLDDTNGMMHLSHQAIGELSFDPKNTEDIARFLAWVSPLCPKDTLRPNGLVQAPKRGMTDTDYPSISIMTHASHRAVADKMGQTLELERWRGNIWLDGTQAWEELDWLGKDIQIGDAILNVIEPIERCKHTMANPRTGDRDADTLAALRDGWNHQDFGVYAKVIKGGKIAVNDTAKVV